MVILATSIYNGDGSVNAAVIIGTIAATLSLIFIIIIVIVVMCRRRKISRRSCSIHDRAIPPMPTHSTSVQSQLNHTDCNLTSQLRHQINPTSRVEVVNVLYASTTVKSPIQLQGHDASRTDVNDCNVIITPNPLYAVSSNSLQTGNRKSEYQYNYVQADKELTQPATLTAEDYDDVINPAEDVNIVPNPSYSVPPPDGQDVTLQDNPSYNKTIAVN